MLIIGKLDVGHNGTLYYLCHFFCVSKTVVKLRVYINKETIVIVIGLSNFFHDFLKLLSLNLYIQNDFNIIVWKVIINYTNLSPCS